MNDWAKITPTEQSRLDQIKRNRRKSRRDFQIKQSDFWIFLALLAVLSFGAGWATSAYGCGDTSTQCIACDVQGAAL